MSSSSPSSPRVASLLPSTTEIVAALGAADLLVGVSHECDWPQEIAARVASGALPVLTSSRLAAPVALAGAGGAGAEGVSASALIDARLRILVSQALSIYQVDEQALAACAPDIVLTQDLCEVCAVSYSETCRALSHLSGHDVEVITTHPTSLEEIWGDVLRIGEAIGRAPAAQELVANLRARVDAVAERAKAAQHKPRVLTLEWIDPPMPGGLWMAELVELAGGLPVGDQRGAKTHTLSAEQLAELNPDVLVVKPCGFTLKMALAELPGLRAVVPWESWPACREGRVYFCDGSAYFNRPGPRIADSLELLAACAHPELFADFAEQYSGAYRLVD